MSASSSAASGARLTSTVVDAVVASHPAEAPRLPPAESIASAIWLEVRVAVPWSSSVAVICASPAFAAGSDVAPERIIRLIETTGCSLFSRKTTRRPFGSRFS